MIQQGEVLKYVCTHVCKTHKGEVEVTLGLPRPLTVSVETCLIAIEGR